ncbi:putative LPLAT superfamily acyltransferase [Sinobacterium caligoides]|uniref:Putative LPLAT superfamily acyltransferase n=1 Tax=Sinobacterium caligoides TaxID=933926 RepID=A0A3N2DQK5_9GAMM|nr:glycosyltransferase family 2 protein [Sinobacterium caligoides]ROS01585.1 putative LPLAT superfamily acyltransferase [Sinobacterium caligoides]
MSADYAGYCVVIPIYNHGSTIAATVDAVLAFDLSVIIVDDGSSEPTRVVLAELNARHQRVKLLTLVENSGKGAAVMTGLRHARSLGYSHAIQIDADGQHDSDDVPRLIEMSQQHPGQVVSGRPIYDESVPKSRLYGRYITHVWVWIETLSLALKDTMCGFRVYPLPAIELLLDTQRLGSRMDFDTEVLVKLYWQGVDTVFMPTRVTYPEDGLSHFDVVRDNIQVSRMHTRLFFGMLPRLPYLLWRRRSETSHVEETQHWSRMAERGSAWGIRMMLGLYNLFGRKVFSYFLKPVMGYYYLTSKTARSASKDYIAQLQRYDPGQGALSSFDHFLAFGEAMLDKLAAWSGKLSFYEVDIMTPLVRDEILAHVDRKEGLLLLGSHLGNIEVCRALSENHRGAVVNAVVFTEHAESFNNVLKKVNANSSVNLLPVSDIGPETIILLKQKVDAGEWVVIVGDRTSTTKASRMVWQSFLGKPAPFAQGPFILASLLACPVYLMFGLKQGERYQLSFERFADPLVLPRATRQQALSEAAARYAARLEHHCRQAPLQWFNFFDFWKLSNSKDD